MTQNKEIFVVKIGSNTLIDNSGQIRQDIVVDILTTAAKAISKSSRVLLVTSGAGKLGKSILNNKQDITVNVSSAVGQIALFSNYHSHAQKINLTLAELLIARPHLLRRNQFLKLQQNMEDFFKQGIVPLVNENDALVADTDWDFGDNDSLAAALAIAFNAKKLIILSHVDGLYNKDPDQSHGQVELIKNVEDVNLELLKYCSKTTSSGGRGGMLSKLKAIRICTAVGIEAQIINGLKKGNLGNALNGKDIGTIFKSRCSKNNISNRQRWLLAAKNSSGSIEVDQGAVEALRSGKSMLAVGVKKVYGQFQKGEIIEIVDSNQQGIAFGIVDYSDQEVEQMLEKKDLTGKQLMHTDNIIVFS